MDEDDGQAFASQRQSDHPVERLAELLRQDILAKRQQMLGALMPDGRKPFHVALSRAETRRRLLDARPPDWRRWQAEVQAIPDPEQRRQTLGKLFDSWADVTMSKQGIGTTESAEVGFPNPSPGPKGEVSGG